MLPRENPEGDTSMLLATDPSPGLGLFIILLGLALYVLPSGLALQRGHPNAAAIVVVNLLLGWTFVGWVAALAWSLTRR